MLFHMLSFHVIHQVSESCKIQARLGWLSPLPLPFSESTWILVGFFQTWPFSPINMSTPLPSMDISKISRNVLTPVLYDFEGGHPSPFLRYLIKMVWLLITALAVWNMCCCWVRWKFEFMTSVHAAWNICCCGRRPLKGVWALLPTLDYRIKRF